MGGWDRAEYRDCSLHSAVALIISTVGSFARSSDSLPAVDLAGPRTTVPGVQLVVGDRDPPDFVPTQPIMAHIWFHLFPVDRVHRWGISIRRRDRERLVRLGVLLHRLQHRCRER